MGTVNVRRAALLCACLLALMGLCGCGPNQHFCDLTINSEPQGARIYEGAGRFLGTTPYEAVYDADARHFDRGVLQTTPLICVLPGYLPQKKQVRLDLTSVPRPNFEEQAGGVTRSQYHCLFLLRRDPTAPRTVTHRYDVTTRREDSGLDKALKFGQLMMMVDTLTPNR